MTDRRRTLEAIHVRVVAGDPLAAKDLFELVHRPLWRILTGTYGAGGLAEEQAIDSATDAIAEYIRGPQKYEPQRASLFTYLAVIAKRDALNQLRDAATYCRKLKEFVELEPSDGNIGDDQAIATRLDAETIVRKYGDRIADNKTDIEVLKLMLLGESDTDAYAAAIGAISLPAGERKAAVKKYRDKMEKRLQRLSKEL